MKRIDVLQRARAAVDQEDLIDKIKDAGLKCSMCCDGASPDDIVMELSSALKGNGSSLRGLLKEVIKEALREVLDEEVK